MTHAIPSGVSCMTGRRPGRTSLPASRLFHSGKRAEGGLCGTMTQCVVVAAIAHCWFSIRDSLHLFFAILILVAPLVSLATIPFS